MTYRLGRWNLRRNQRGFGRRVRCSKTVMFLMVTFLTMICACGGANTVRAATDGTITLNVSRNSAILDLLVADDDGNFASSGSGEEISFGVTTDNATGYTLSLVAGSNDTDLVDAESGARLESIGEAVNAETFDTADYNGKWGWKPSKLNSIVNTNYLPAPTTVGTVMDKTEVANTIVNSYTIALGVRAAPSQPAGSYMGTYVLQVIANEPEGEITYKPVTDLRAGDYVTYVDANGDEIECRVLYDTENSDYGLQIVAMNTLKQISIGNGKGNYQNTSTNNGTGLYIIAKKAYNDARSTLNAAAREYINPDLSDVNDAIQGARVVGTKPDAPDLENSYYSSTNSSYTYINNAEVRRTDTYYLTDLTQMNTIGAAAISSAYWLGSYYLYAGTDTTTLYIRIVLANATAQTTDANRNRILNVTKTASNARSYNITFGLRPVFSLKETLYINGGSGTQGDPYTLTVGE